VLKVFAIFSCLVDEKSNSKFKLAPLKLLILKILPVTRFKDPKAGGDFDTENAYRKPPVIL
jgi:hypothetical protein